MLCEFNKCTGCSACFAACSFEAISMKEDKLGVLHPEINFEKCKKCGLCEKVCPVLKNRAGEEPKMCYAAYTKNSDDIKTVASGGIATAFGKYVLSDNGVVYGTVFNNEAKFACAESEGTLEEFKGSKYVYVFPDKIYQDVKIKLQEGKKCLFVGTPCQIDGLKTFLQREYDNLITVDLICHGTPPFAYLKEHLSKMKVTCKKVTFRGKNNYCLTCYDAEENIICSMPHHLDEYFYSFLNSLTCREVCYSCQYAKADRVSDLTIGDFWGLDPKALSGYDGKKSVILINTQKGKEFFEKAKEFLVYEERSVAEAVNGNAQLRQPAKRHKKRDRFIQSYEKSGFNNAMRETGISFIVNKNKIKNMMRNTFRKFHK